MLAIEEGTVIIGKYRLERPLARGGMGSVWIGLHMELGVTVAIKFIDGGIANSDAARTRFKREGKAAAQLKSPNVVQVYDYGVEDGTPYMVMELLEGEDLGAKLKRERRLSIAAARDILTPVCKAVHRAHEIGLVHRDLKPANIFLSRSADESIVKVLDFGIAKWTDPDDQLNPTQPGMMVGSPQFMSPEQARSKDVDFRSDLWSLGVIAFRAITGHLPFKGDSLPSVVMAICIEPLPIASQVAPGLGPEVDRFFERALARDPAGRFQSAREMAEALAALAAREGAEAAKLQTWSGVHTGASLGMPTAQLHGTEGGVPASSGAVPAPTNVVPAPRRRTGMVAAIALGGVVALGLGGYVALHNRAPEPVAPSAMKPEAPPPVAAPTVEAHPTVTAPTIAPAASTALEPSAEPAQPKASAAHAHAPPSASARARPTPTTAPTAPPQPTGHGIF